MGMFTFSDGSKPAAHEAVGEAEIQIKEEHMFQFNNSAIFVKEEKGDLTHHFWSLALANFDQFATFIKDKNKVPVSL